MTPPLLEVCGVSKQFGGLHVLRDVNLSIGAGELRCIIGPNGCGKTTLFNIITGAFPPTAGAVRFRGEDITGRAAHAISRLGIARKFQVPGVYPTLAVAENVEIALLSRRGIAGPWSLLRAGPRVAARLHALLARFNLSLQAVRGAGTLPHGQKQWLEIAMLIGTDAQILLLDEPTAGMSATETSATVELIRHLQHEQGIAALVIEHDMNFVRRLACPVVVMLRGSVLFEGGYAEVQAHPEVREAYLGHSARLTPGG